MRKPWLAAALSILQSGLGHLYLGRGIEAVVLFLAMPLSYFLLLRLAILVARPLNILFILCLPTVVVAIAVNAFKKARRPREQPLPWYSRWWACVSAMVLSALILTPVTDLLRDSWVRAADMPSGSMEPTILPGDRVLIDRARYGFRVPQLDLVLRPRSPERGDVVELISPHDKKRLLKRVIGVPAEAVQARSNVIYVDGRRIDEPYALVGSEPNPAMPDWGPNVVPAGHVFVLGDNRDRSFDSRSFGFVRQADILGRAEIVYFSFDFAGMRPRWNRTGRRIH